MPTVSKTKPYSMESQLIHGKSESGNWDYGHQLVPPLSTSATFKLDSVERGAQGFVEFAHSAENKGTPPIYIYERLGEPNKNLLEESLMVAEKGEMAISFATGMAAISGIVFTLCKTGDEVISHHTLYGCTYSLFTNWLPRFGITNRKMDLKQIQELKDYITDKTRVIYFESPVNPTLELIDIGAIREIVDEVNKHRSPHNLLYVVVDNTFATPFCQQPITLGADYVVHSLTKNIGGFGTDMGGAVIGKTQQLNDLMLIFRKDFGGVLNNHSAWAHLVYGLPTLSLRMKQQQETTLAVANFLENHPKISYVRYPGLPSFPQYALAQKQMIDYNGQFAPGSMLFFSLKGSDPSVIKHLGANLMNDIAKNSYTITLAVSLGNIRTLIEHPASMTHSAIPAEEQILHGLDPGGIRLSIGLESASDIIRDLSEALDKLG